MKLKIRLALAAAIMVLTSLTLILCDARVYLRTGRSAEAGALAQKLGGSIVYQSDVNINGGAGRLSVIKVPRDFQSTAAALAEDKGSAKSLFFTGASMGNGLMLEDDAVTRLLLVGLQTPDQCLLFAVRQTPAEYDRSRHPPARRLLAGMPVFSGSQPVSYWRDEKARLAVEISRAGGSSAEVAAFLRAKLTADGWTPPAGGTGAPSPASGTTLLYIKGDRLCCVAARATEDGGTLITVLHKSLETE